MRVKFLLRMLVLLLLVPLGTIAARAAVEEQPAGEARGRLAIVIGNGDYRSARLEHLANAVNDARRLAETLKRLNFDVIVGTDLTAEGFDKLFRDAEDKLPEVGAVLIFYAGHGVQFGGENYLLPIDTPDPESVGALTARAVKLNQVIARFADRERQTFVFLDACRNNPLPGAPGGNGLAQVEVGENTFIAFATQPGNVTVDGAGHNSPFTTALLKSVEIPGLSISDMMIRVRNDTEALTIGRQVPWDQSNLREQFYFTEMQVLDPTELSASLSRILADPIAKEKLQVELASSDLQTAVLVVGQSLRSVDLSAGSPAASGAPTQLASLNAEEAVGAARKSVVTGLSTLIVGTSAGDAQDETGHRPCPQHPDRAPAPRLLPHGGRRRLGQGLGARADGLLPQHPPGGCRHRAERRVARRPFPALRPHLQAARGCQEGARSERRGRQAGPRQGDRHRSQARQAGRDCAPAGRPAARHQRRHRHRRRVLG